MYLIHSQDGSVFEVDLRLRRDILRDTVDLTVTPFPGSGDAPVYEGRGIPLKDGDSDGQEFVAVVQMLIETAAKDEVESRLWNTLTHYYSCGLAVACS